MIWSITEVAALKKEIQEKFAVEIHFHDGCGGQYFTLEKPTEELKGALASFFAAKGLKAVFSESGESFVVERNSSC